ncbi:MAG: ABC transporter permease [Parcubacteria group bacterium]|nr:ABC transporter permease [Parcubacteria group bacterium]
MLEFFRQSVKTSAGALLANKARSFLTMLGIIIGVAAVIVIMAVGAGAQGLILSQIKNLGTNLIGVLPGKSEDKGPPAQVLGIIITTLNYGDALALADKNNVPNLTAVAAYSKAIGTVSWGADSYDTNISGTTASYLDVEGGELEQGRFFTADEEKNLARVAVLGSEVKARLFGASDPAGARIKFKKQSFEVIGVMKKRGLAAFQNYDDQIFMPLATVQKVISGVDYLGFIRAKVDDGKNINRAINDISLTLRERHNIIDQSGASDDFTVRSAAQALGAIATVTDALRFFLAAMAALSLLVGGIGIMNIMLVSVTERTREIGLRKAVGASNKDIRRQFLTQAVIITLLGGLIGIALGVLTAVLISLAARFLGYSWDLVISWLSIALAVAVSAAIGLIFGLYPAFKASRLEPVEALRHE